MKAVVDDVFFAFGGLTPVGVRVLTAHQFETSAVEEIEFSTAFGAGMIFVRGVPQFICHGNSPVLGTSRIIAKVTDIVMMGLMLKTSKEMTNLEVSQLLRMMAAALEAKNGEFFRVKAYENAASSIEHETSALRDLWEEGKLDQVPSLGKGLVEHLDELFSTGRVKHFEEEMKGLPQGMFALLDLPGVGPKTAFKLATAFKLNDFETAKKKVLQAAKEGKIDRLEGFGEESQKQIAQAIEEKREMGGRLLMHEAERLAGEVIAYLKSNKVVEKVESLGSLRRKSATVGDIDIAVATKDPGEVMRWLKEYPGVGKEVSSGPNMTIFVHKLGPQVDVKTCSPLSWGSMLQHYTGSKMHNIHLRKLALQKGLSLSEGGIKDKKGKVVPYSDEKKFYQALGMEWMPPEMREDTGEIEAGIKQQVPDLVELGQIKGDLHMHTNIEMATSHDLGVNSVSEMISRAENLGYEYIGLSDHNPRLSEMSEVKRIELVKRRNEAIEQEIYSRENSMKRKSAVKVLKGLEVDIRPDGSLAASDKLLAELDYAIASVHSAFGQDKETATKRVLEGLAHPKVRIWGHPSGRMIQERLGLDYDWEKVFEFCIKERKLVEVSGWPNRLDLSDVLVRMAINVGVMLVINTDAHRVEQLDFMKYGVYNARRGWAQARDVANTRSRAAFEKLLFGVE